MLLLAKIGTLSTQLVRVVRLRKLPDVGQVFQVYENIDRNKRPIPGTKPVQVRLTQVVGRPGSDALYLLERF